MSVSFFIKTFFFLPSWKYLGLRSKIFMEEMSKSFEFMNCIFISQKLKHKLFSQQVVATFCKLPDFFCNECLVKVLLSNASKREHEADIVYSDRRVCVLNTFFFCLCYISSLRRPIKAAFHYR